MPRTVDPHRQLHQHFGFREFLEGQESVIDALLQGRDALVIMPTGGGKSLCYQLPALALEGVTVVVSPLIALMKDQVDGLVERKIPATFINSSISQPEVDDRIRRMTRGEFRLVYIAPERFKSEHFVRALAPLSIALFAVDEAHCISQWGHDFRPDYLRLKWALKEVGQPPVVALTATATPEVRQDIIEQLGLGKFGRRPPQVFVSGFARRNLTLAVALTKNKAEKLAHIVQTVRKLKNGIIYCATRKNVESVATHLGIEGFRCIAYHGGMNDEQRTRAQAEFMSGKFDVAVATNAFGMGIDRADLRFVVHYDIPGSVEAYYQEAGRAGRDGEPARCELLFNYADVQTQEFFIEGANPTREVIAGLYQALIRLCAGGPMEIPIAEIAEHVSEATNEMAVGSALYLLERGGFIQRTYRKGSRTYTTWLVEPIKPLEQLPIDFTRLDAKRERDFAKLRRMLDYVDHRGCRHRFILGYFGDQEACLPEHRQAAAHCQACDHCLSRLHAAQRLPTEEETVIIQKALSCVARLNGRFGRTRITQTLVGSRSKEVLDARLDRFSTYGLLADLGSDYVWGLLNALIQAGCIAASDSRYPTLALTKLGGEVMRCNKSVPLVMPEGAESGPFERSKRKSRRSAAGHQEPPHNETLFKALRSWRREKAVELGNLPAYVVYTDRTLKELAARMPQTQADLLEVPGIGPAKARQYGAETLALIRRLSDKKQMKQWR